MTEEVKVLSGDELNRLESKSQNTSLDYAEVDEILRSVPALCATVRALRAADEHHYQLWLDLKERHQHQFADGVCGQCQVRLEDDHAGYDCIAWLQRQHAALREQLAHLQSKAHYLTCGARIEALESQLAQVTQERDALRGSASVVAFQAHQIDGQIATSLMDNARKQCVKRVREYLTDCRDEETGIIEAIALELESLAPKLEQP